MRAVRHVCYGIGDYLPAAEDGRKQSGEGKEDDLLKGNFRFQPMLQILYREPDP